MKNRVLVTGAAGFVGQHLIKLLLESNFEVTAIIRYKKDIKLLPKNIEVEVADLSKKGIWQKQFKRSDTIIHLAAQIASKTYKEFEKNNVTATFNLIQAAKKVKTRRVILFSSAAVTSIRKDWYAQTKLEQEEIVKKSEIPYICIRPSMIYGPNDTKNIGWLIKIIKMSPIIPLPGGGNFGRQPVYVEDLCKIVIKLIITKQENRIYEIHGYKYLTMKQMVKIISKKLQTKKLIIPVPLFFLHAAIYFLQFVTKSPKFTTDQIKSLTSGEKFKGEKWWKTFDIIPTSFETGVEKMIKQ